jgi:tetratricopeptide (TPR) repeat protein
MEPALPVPQQELLAAAAKLKAEGTELFAAKDFAGGAAKYEDAIQSALDLPGGTAECQAIKVSCALNAALCHLKVGNYGEAVSISHLALEIEPRNVKALFRRGTAHMSLKRFTAAKTDLLDAARIAPANKEVRNALRALQRKVRDQAIKQKAAFSGLFGEALSVADTGGASSSECTGASCRFCNLVHKTFHTAVGDLCQRCIGILDWTLRQQEEDQWLVSTNGRPSHQQTCDTCCIAVSLEDTKWCDICQAASYCPDCSQSSQEIPNICGKPTHKTVWSPPLNESATKYALAIADGKFSGWSRTFLEQNEVQVSLECRFHGFERTFDHKQNTIPAAELESRFHSYAPIYFSGSGRWDKGLSKYDGLSTYGLRTCLGIVIADSLQAPQRCALLHCSLYLDVSDCIVDAANWVCQGKAGTANRRWFGDGVEILVIKGVAYRHAAFTNVQSELRWGLTDGFLPNLRGKLDHAGLAHIPLRLEHEPTYSGAVCVGIDGVCVPTVPFKPDHGLLGQELPLRHIAARHSAFCEYESEEGRKHVPSEATITIRHKDRDHAHSISSKAVGKLDLQFDVIEHTACSLHLQKFWVQFKDRQLDQMPCQPLCKLSCSGGGSGSAGE